MFHMYSVMSRRECVCVHTEIMESKWSGLDIVNDTALNLNTEHIEMAISKFCLWTPQNKINILSKLLKDFH